MEIVILRQRNFCSFKWLIFVTTEEKKDDPEEEEDDEEDDDDSDKDKEEKEEPVRVLICLLLYEKFHKIFMISR